MATHKDPTIRWTQEDCMAWLDWICATFDVAVTPRINVNTTAGVGVVWEVGLEIRTSHSSEEPAQLLCRVWTVVPKGQYASLWALVGRLTGLAMAELQLLYGARFEPT